LLTGFAPGVSTLAIRARFKVARASNQARISETGVPVNARLPPRILRAACALDARAARLLAAAAERLDLSARGYDRILRVSRTIADLAGQERVSADHVAEALQFR
jgi:magnesium chelatase family protein